MRFVRPMRGHASVGARRLLQVRAATAMLDLFLKEWEEFDDT